MDNTPQQTPTPNNQPAQPIQPVQQPPQTQGSSSSPSNPPKHSKKKLYIIIAIGLIISILAALFLSKVFNPSTPAPVNTTIQNNNLTPTSQANESNALPPENSDTQLNQDLQNIDTSLNSTDTGIENVDQGLSDQQTNLTE